MSTVYRAERRDGSLKRQVALKVIRRGMETADARRRFRAEQRILSTLEHPNIARLYDGGVTEAGLPYFVMEHVEGRPIDEFCDQRDLGVRARIELFLEVCRAVSFAHRNLVVHRDLKPSNILVDAEGRPKLLDFGIAKLLGPPASGRREEATAAWARLITPHYAAPEQMRGAPVTTAGDVYSLGVLLFKLLTGSVPFAEQSRSLGELERLLMERLPDRPSRRAPEPRARRLEGDLDTIVLQALQPSVDDRYSTVEELAEDLRRHLRGFPVSARRPTWRYRASKFVRRHAVAVGVATIFTWTVLAALLGLAIQSEQIRRERDQLREVVRFTEEVFNVAGEGEKLTVRQAIDRSADLLESKLSGQPEVEATLRLTIGRIYQNLGAPPDAVNQLERAVELRRREFGEESLEAAESLSALAVAQAGAGQLDDAVANAGDAVTRYREILGDRHPDLVEPLNNLVTALCFRGDYEQAREPAAEAVTLARQLLGQDRLERANAFSQEALLRTRQGDHQGAVNLYSEALEALTESLGEAHPEVAVVLSNLSTAYERLGDLDQAEALLRRTLAIEQDLYQGPNANLAGTYFKLGSLLGARQRFEDAESLLQEARKILLEIFGPGHYSFAVVTTDYASMLLKADRPTEAENLLREALPAWQEHLAGTYFLASAESLLGESLLDQGQATEAEPLLRRSYQALVDLRGPDASPARNARARLDRLQRMIDNP
jgi:serine/threonine-protein kinase